MKQTSLFLKDFINLNYTALAIKPHTKESFCILRGLIQFKCPSIKNYIRNTVMLP